MDGPAGAAANNSSDFVGHLSARQRAIGPGANHVVQVRKLYKCAR